MGRWGPCSVAPKTAPESYSEQTSHIAYIFIIVPEGMQPKCTPRPGQSRPKPLQVRLKRPEGGRNRRIWPRPPPDSVEHTRSFAKSAQQSWPNTPNIWSNPP